MQAAYFSVHQYGEKRHGAIVLEVILDHAFKRKTGSELARMPGNVRHDLGKVVYG